MIGKKDLDFLPFDCKAGTVLLMAPPLIDNSDRIHLPLVSLLPRRWDRKGASFNLVQGSVVFFNEKVVDFFVSESGYDCRTNQINLT